MSASTHSHPAGTPGAFLRQALLSAFAAIVFAGVVGMAPGVREIVPSFTAPAPALAGCTATSTSYAPDMNGYLANIVANSATPATLPAAFNGSATRYFWVKFLNKAWTGFSTYAASNPDTAGTGTSSNCNNYFKYTSYNVGSTGKWGVYFNGRIANTGGNGYQPDPTTFIWHNPTNVCTTLTDYRCAVGYTLTEGNYAVADQSLKYAPCTTIYTAALNLANAETGAAPGANCETVVTDTTLNQATAFIYDVTLPTMSATAPASITKNSSITFTVTDTSLNGSAAVALAPLNTATVTAADFAVTNGSVSSISCTAATATCDVVVTASGDGTVTLAKSGTYSVSDTATNAGTAFTAASLTYDGTAPTVSSFTTAESSPTKAASIAYSLVFSESVTGLASGDFSNAGTATGCSFGVTGSGTTYTITVTGCSTTGTLIPRLATAGVTDAAGNTGPAANADGSTLTLDRVAPAVSSFTTAVSSPTNATSISFDLTFSETVTGLASSDISNAGTATGCSYAIGGSNATYTVTVTGCSTTGTLALRLAADGVTDTAGNTGPASTASAASTLTLDRVSPAVSSFTTAVASPTNSTSIAYSLVFDESVTGLASGDFSNTGTAASCSFGVSGSGTTYTVTVTGCSTTGTLTPRLATNSVADAAGNSGPSEIDAATLTLDRVAPGVSSFTSTTGSPTNAASLVYSLVFNESVTGLAAGDFTIGGTATGWSVASIIGSGTSYTVTLTGGTDGTVSLTLELNKVADAAGNTGPADASVAASSTITVDTVAPSAMITTAVSSPTNSTSIAYAVAFDESVTGLATGDFSNAGTATSCSFAVSGSGSSYTVTVTGCSASGTLVPRLAANGVVDAAGNTGPAAGTNGTSLTLDRVAPTASITTAESSPTKSASIDYSVSFSESVTGLAAGDFANNGTATGCSFGVSGSGSAYTLTVTSCSTTGTLVPRLAASGVSDLAGNAGPAANTDGSSLTLDRVAPTVTITTAVTSPTNSTSIAYTVTFSESVTGLASGDFANNGTAASCSFGITGSGASYTVTVTSCGTTGTLVPRLAADSVADAAGNSGPASATDGTALTLDRVAPTVSITTTESSPTNSASIAYSVSFSESVTGLAAGDFSNAGTATGCSFAVTGSGSSYTVTATSCSTTGTLEPRLGASTVADLAGNAGPAAAADGASLTLDRVVPTATVTTTETGPTKATSIDYSVSFSESVTGVTAGDFSNQGTATGCSFSVSGTGDAYTVTVTDCSASGTLIVRLAAAAASDAAGNAGPALAVNAASLSLDRVAPTVSITTSVPSKTNSTSIAYSVTFSEAVTGLATGDFSNAGTATGCDFALSGSGTSYTLTVTGCSTTGTLTPRLAADSVTDAAGNAGPAADEDGTSLTLDRVAPTVSITTSESSPTNSTSIAYAVSFTESVTGLAAGDFTNAGTATGCSFGVTGSGSAYTLTVTSCATTGTLEPRLAAGAVTDLAGNAGPASATDGDALTLDRVKATVAAFTSAVASPSNSTSITWTLVFGEVVTGLTAGDISDAGSATCTWSVSGSGTTYTITGADCDNAATAQPKLAAGSVADAAGNASPASDVTGTAIAIDRTPAGVTSFSTTAGSHTNASTISYTLVFADAVTGLTAADFSNTGTATGCQFSVSGSGTSYTVSATSCSNGTLELTLRADAVADAAGNTSPAQAVSADAVTIDRSAITVSQFDTAAADVTSDSSIDYTLVFNKSVTGLAAGDFSNAGTATGCSFSVSGSGDSYTITVASCSSTGTLRPRLNGNGVGDAAGNTGPASAAYGETITLDAVAPTLTSFTFANLSAPVVGQVLAYNLVFSEEVTGLTAGDFTITGSATGWSISSLAGSGASYSVTLTGGTAGSVTLTLKANAVADAAGTTAPSQATSVTVTVAASADIVTGGDTQSTVGEGSITLTGGDFDFGSAYPGEGVTAGADFSVTSNNDMGYEVTLVLSDLTKTGVRKNGDKVPASIVIIDSCPTVLFATTNNGNWEAEPVCPTSAFDAPRLVAKSGIRSRANGDVFTLALGFVIPWIEEGTYNGTATFTASSL
jgi:hypothetical protein